MGYNMKSPFVPGLRYRG